MQKQFYIFGINHKIQYHRLGIDDDRLPMINEWRHAIHELWQKENIDLLSEEFSKELCVSNNVEKSVLEQLAGELEIQHLFFLINDFDRKKLNIESKNHDARENIWLERILNTSCKNIVVAIGQEHVSGFSSKAKNLGISCVALKENYGNSLL